MTDEEEDAAEREARLKLEEEIAEMEEEEAPPKACRAPAHRGTPRIHAPPPDAPLRHGLAPGTLGLPHQRPRRRLTKACLFKGPFILNVRHV